MSGKGFETGSKDEFDELLSRVEDLEAKVTLLSNIKQPTMPPYPSIATPNPGDVPDDPLEGQFAVANDDSGAWYYVNGKWRRAGARLPYIKLWSGGPASVIAGRQPLFVDNIGPLPPTAGTTFPADHNFVGTIDDTIFSVDSSPYTHVNILSPGLYFASAVQWWYLDWEKIFMDINFTASQVFNVINLDGSPNGEHPSELSAQYPGASVFNSPPHDQVAVKRTAILSVDNVGALPAVFKPEIVCGSNRTFSGGDQRGTSFFVMQLTSDSTSNP